MKQTEDHNQKVYEFHKEQNEINKQTVETFQKLANQLERSNDRHDVNDSRILDIENFIDYSKPIVDRSNWIQSAFSDFAKKILLPAMVVAILAAAGYNLIPSSNNEAQKQEQKK